MQLNKFIPILIILAASGLIACSSPSSPRRHAVEDLAQPPKVQPEQGATAAVNTYEEGLSVKSNKEPLGDKVYLLDAKPTTLRIELPFKKAWYAVRLALQHVGADITGIDSEEGIYLINYKAGDEDSGDGGILQSFWGGLFSRHSETSRYQILLKEQGAETEVVVSVAKERKKEKYIYNPDGYQEAEPVAEPDILFEHLYNALREDVVMKATGI